MQSENFLKKSSARRVAPLQSGVRYVVQPLAGHQFGEEAACGDQLVIGPVLDSDTFFCVMLSSALVASSNIKILGFGAMARAIISR